MDEDRYLRIPVQPMDALPEVLAKVRSHGGRPVFLSIPASSPLFLTASEFRALRETVRSANANLVVISSDRQRQDFAQLFNLIPAENEEAAILWIGDQSSARPPVRPAVDPALGPPRATGTSGWVPRVDPRPVAAEPTVEAAAPAQVAPVAATTALVPVPAPLPETETKQRRRRWPWLLSLLLVLALLAGTAAVLPQATVTLTRERTPITTDLLVAVTEPGADASASNAPITVAGERQTATVTVTATLPATGQQSMPDQPAKGAIAFANAGTEPITLAAGTQFTSDGGIVFSLDEAVTVPAASGNLSGNADGNVTAVEGGTAGNLGQGALSGRHESGVFFSNRNGALTGGTDRMVTVFSEQDMAAAIAELEARIPQAMSEALSESAGSEVAIVPGSVTHPDLAPSPFMEIGTETAEFTVSATTEATGLAFDPASVREEMLAAATAQITVPEGQNIDVRDAEITWSDAGASDLVNGTVLVWQVVDVDDAAIDDLREKIARGTVDDAITDSTSIPGVESASIEVKPDWLPAVIRERMPLLPQRIEVIEE